MLILILETTVDFTRVPETEVKRRIATGSSNGRIATRSRASESPSPGEGKEPERPGHRRILRQRQRLTADGRCARRKHKAPKARIT